MDESIQELVDDMKRKAELGLLCCCHIFSASRLSQRFEKFLSLMNFVLPSTANEAKK